MSGDPEASKIARRAADAVERAREVADAVQPDLFEAPAPVDQVDAAPRRPGRPKGARNKAKTGLADWLAAQGYRAPGEQLAALAGLATRSDPTLQAIQRTEAIAAALGVTGPKARLALFFQIIREMRQAADALLPYTAEKITPDVAAASVVQIGIMGRPTQGAAGALAAGMGPPPMPQAKAVENQTVDHDPPTDADDETRTEGASD